MLFYIYQNGSLVEKKANLMAISEDVKDETLDTAKIEIYFDDSAEPYAPRTLCKIIDKDDSSTSGYRSYYYHVATDNVEIQTLDPRTYKHTLTLVQATRKLSHYMLPNMVITKPREGTASTYFANENTLNYQYYLNNTYAQETGGLEAWDGFTCRCFTASGTPFTHRLYDMGSPYWVDCLALTTRTKAQSARIKVYFDGLYCTAVVNSSTHTAKSAKATFKRLDHLPTAPSFLTPNLVVYHSKGNVGPSQSGSTDKDVIATIPLSNVTWVGNMGYYDLTEDELATLNSYTSGYLTCDIESEITGTFPTSLVDTTDNEKILSTYDKLFADKTEFTEKGYQTIWSRVSLELKLQTMTLYDVLGRILARQQLKYSGSTNKQLFSLPSSGDDYEILKNTESPEFSFINLTVFEAVSKVLETIDALPRFDCDDEGNLTLALDYFNQTGNEVANDTKFASYVSNATEQKRDNGILTNFQNAEVLCNFPCKPYGGVPVFTRARTKSYGVPEYTDFTLAVDKPIKYVNHLWVRCNFSSIYVVYATGETQTWGAPKYKAKQVLGVAVPIDLSSFIFDEATYSSALAQGGDFPLTYNHNIRMQQNCVKFKKGSKYIDIGIKTNTSWNITYNTFWQALDSARNRAFGIWCVNHKGPTEASYPATIDYIYTFAAPTENSFKDVYFACEYLSDIDGRLEIQSPYPKEDGQFVSSTSSNSPDLGKLGLNMIGVSLKSGEPTMTCTQMLSTWGKRIKVGDVFTKNDEKWIATKASYSVLGSDINSETIKGTIEFTKNFNGLSKRIAIDQSKRLYNIDRTIASLCEGNIIQYAYFEPMDWAGTDTITSDTHVFGDEGFFKIISKAFTSDENNYCDISLATINTSLYNGRYVPLSVYGAGNCLCFETKYDDPISIGIAMSSNAGSDDYWWAISKWALVTNGFYYYGSDVKYTDGEGYEPYFTIVYWKNTGSQTALPDTFPDCSEMTGVEGVGKLSDLEFNKQPNEIFGLNYELAFLSRYHQTRNEVFFGKAFFDTWNENKKRRTTKLKFVYNKTKDFDYSTKSIDLTQSYGYPVGVSFLKNTNGTCYLNIYDMGTLTPIQSRTVGVNNFCLCDQDGNVLIACNCDPEKVKYREVGGSKIRFPCFHFFVKKERL